MHKNTRLWQKNASNKGPMSTQSKNSTSKKVAIVGWSGYSGIELVKLVLSHPMMTLGALFSRSLDQSLKAALPTAPNVPLLPIEKLSERAEEFDTIFFATPIEVSKELIPTLKGLDVKVIDLSGAFRLQDNSDFSFGLQPWCGPHKKQWVSNPGCYATSVMMALIPLLKDQLIDVDSLVVDAKSGATGAGKSARADLLFCEVDGNCLPYKVGAHQHLPEIAHYLKSYSGVDTDLFFTTHLLSTPRGIISSIYARTKASESDIAQSFKKAYEDYSLVVAGSLSENPELLRLKHVVGTGRTHISFKVYDNKLYLFSCIDNLMKGASSQAIENWNVLHDLRPTTALEELL